MATHSKPSQPRSLAGLLRLLADFADLAERNHTEILSAAPANAAVSTPSVAGGEAATRLTAAADGIAEEAALPASPADSSGHASRRGGKRAAIEAAVRANPTATIKQIVDATGCSHSHASTIRREILPAEDSKKK